MARLKRRKFDGKILLGGKEYDRKWSNEKKGKAWSLFIAGIIETHAWLATDPELPPNVKRVKWDNGLYGLEPILND